MYNEYVSTTVSVLCVVTVVSEIFEVSFNVQLRHRFVYDIFARFERRELTHPMNQCLTILSKFLIKYLWDCRSRNFVPTLEHCWECLHDRIILAGRNSKKFNNLWVVAGIFTINLNAPNL